MPLATLTWRAARAGRWTVRIAGGLMILFFLAFVFGEGVPPVWRMSGREQLYAAGLSSLFLGLAVAWVHQGWGGGLTVAGWGLLAALARRAPGGLMFAIPAAMGVVNLACWWRLRGEAPPPEPARARAGGARRVLVIALGAGLAVFLLLSANEIFAMPPLMAGAPVAMAELAGTWHSDFATVSGKALPGDGVTVAIAPDGGVTGIVGGATVRGGRLMGWRSDLLIQGDLSKEVAVDGASGGHFSAPVNRKGAELCGGFFLSHPGAPKPLEVKLQKR